MDYETILNRQFVMTDTGRIDRVKDLYTTFNPEVDLEALKKGGFLEALNEMMEPVLMDLDDHFPAVLAYWAKRGMVKEFHGRDKPMSWSEYEMKTGYHWREPVGGAPQNRTKGWNSLCRCRPLPPKMRAACIRRLSCSTAGLIPSARRRLGVPPGGGPAGMDCHRAGP